MIRSLLAATLILLFAPATLAQPPARARALPDGAEHWTASPDRITFTANGISFPRRAGAVTFNRLMAFGQRNAGLDNALIYASDDNALIATAYVYLPALAHSGFASVVSEHVMRLQSGAGFRALGSRIAAAGGRAEVAIRADFAGFRGENEASSSAFLRVGRWIVKLRVSGPEARRADVERTLAALLGEIRFRDSDLPDPANPMTLDSACSATPGAPAATLRALDGAEATEDAIMAAAAALPDTDRGVRAHGRDRPGLARNWCVSSMRPAGQYRMPILRILPSPPAEDSRRSVALAVINDSGGAVEVVERRFQGRSRFSLLHHSNAQTRILGSYDGAPTDAQISAVIDGSDRAGNQPRVTITYESNGNANIGLHVTPDTAPSRPAASPGS